ncbi:MAG: short-chain dehydrogenase [Rhodospirillales bacterium]|nr:short-chain dehydrogenase [Rhodospirillales bacterium]
MDEKTTGLINPLSLARRRILVTGASSGIGRATAELLARLGASVIVAGRDEERLARTRSSLVGDGHSQIAFDLSAIDEIPGIVARLAKEGGALSGIAHCAGVQAGRPMRIVDQNFMDDLFRVNVQSGLALARGFRQRGVPASGAAMVLVSSVSAFVGQASNVVYCATKGAVVSATKALAVEFMRDKIRVNCVCPALVETEMADRFRTTMSDEQWQGYVAQYPMGIGQPADIANSVAFLLSDAARWINGTTLVLDGGLLAG